MTAAAMPNLDFAHTKSAGVREYRDETMELAIEADLAKHLTTVKLETTVVIVQPATGKPAYKPVEDPARIDLVPGVVASFLPTADNIVPFFEPVEKPGDFRRIILEIAVQGENQAASRGLKRGRQRRGFAEVATEADCGDTRVPLGKRKNDAPGTVAATVVNKDELDRAARNPEKTALNSP